MAVAYSYVRFSRPEQLRGDSLRRQREAAKAWAHRNGLELDEHLTDLGVSAYRGANRITGALGRFLALVEAGKIERGSHLIVESLDRFSREKVRTVLRSFLDLVDAGIVIVTLMDNQVYSAKRLDEEPFALFGSIMVMIRANEESATKSGRISDAWAQKRASGEVMTARVPAWLDVKVVDGKRSIVPNDGRVRIVRRIFEWTIAGYGRRQVVQRLKGEPPFGGGRNWQPSYIAKILANRAVLGEHQAYRRGADGGRVPAGEPRSNYFPAIVDEVTFLRANAAKEARATTAGKRGEGVSNILQGLTRCGACGQRMVRENKGAGPKGGRPFLVCTASKAGDCGNDRRWKVDWVERRVLEGAVRLDLTKVLDMNDVPAAGPTADDLRLRRTALTSRRKALIKLVEVEDEGALERYEELAREIAALDEDIANRQAEERRLLSAVPADERRARIAGLIVRLDQSEGDERTALRMRLAQELRASLTAVRFYKGEIGVVYREGRVGKGAVLRKPAYIPVFRDHADHLEELRDGMPDDLDPDQLAKDRAWLTDLAAGKKA